MRTRRLALSALLAAVALTIFVLESQIPIPIPVPGLRLGLSNIITIFALFALGWKEALAILLVRIVLGNLFSGQVTAMLYSLGGGLCCFAAIALLRPHLQAKQVWIAGVVGGIFHNFGQMAVAVAVSGTKELLLYLPVLLLCGMATGALTGLCAQLLLRRRLK